MIKPLIFAGTTEGRELALFFNENEIVTEVYTATEYGEQVLPEMKYVKIHSGRLSFDDINNLIESKKSENIIIIDATHPYAACITENLYKSAKENSVEYFRILRPSTYSNDGHLFENIEKAANYLKDTTGNILLATGSKEIAKYKDVGDMTRIFPRVLPDIHVIENILNTGIPLKNIICMQGPFSIEINVATLHHINAKFLVTKDSGIAGGFDEKLKAAKKVGAELIVIARPREKVKGWTVGEFKKIIKEII